MRVSPATEIFLLLLLLAEVGVSLSCLVRVNYPTLLGFLAGRTGVLTLLDSKRSMDEWFPGPTNTVLSCLEIIAGR